MAYEIVCLNCTAHFDVMEAAFCNHSHPTKVCPFCLSCYCEATEEYKDNIIKNSPTELLEEKKNIENKTYQRLGEILIKADRINKEQLEEAVSKQAFVKKKLGEILIMLGYISEDELKLYLLGQKWIDTVDLKNQKTNYSLIKEIGPQFCLKYRVIPIELFNIEDEWFLRLILLDYDKLVEIKQLEELRHTRIIPYKADTNEIERILTKIKKNIDEGDVLVLS